MTLEANFESESRVLPLISDAGNRTLLVEWIDDHPSLGPVELAEKLGETTFDVCILDKAAFQKHYDDLRAIKTAAAPVLVPCLLLLPESGSSIIETDAGQLADNVVTETVDELVSLPIQQAELHWRLAALIRLRDQSLRLHNRKRDLEQQVAVLHTAQEIAGVGAWEYDIDSGEWWWSNEFRCIHALPEDVPPSADESFQYYHPEDRPTIERAFETAIEDGEPYDLELRFTDAEDNHRRVRTVGKPQHVDGKLSSVRGIIQDITEPKDRRQ